MSEHPRARATPAADEPAPVRRRAGEPGAATLTARRASRAGPAAAEPRRRVAAPAPWTGRGPAPAAAGRASADPAAAAAAGAGESAVRAALPERPEIAVGAAFAGGLVLALILKRLAR